MTGRRWIQFAFLALALVYPLLTTESAVYQRMGALVLLAAIGASAWNIVGGYAGQVSVGHAVFFGIGGPPSPCAPPRNSDVEHSTRTSSPTAMVAMLK